MPKLDNYGLDNYLLDGKGTFDSSELKVYHSSIRSSGGVISVPFKPMLIIAELYGVIYNYIDTRDKISLSCTLVSYLTNTGEVKNFSNAAASGPNSSVQAFINASFGNDTVAISINYYNGSYNNDVFCTVLGF
ncbi:hypothetical protein ACN9MH_06350 [Paenibacillus silvae]|jgi:hypothetical protein|uniref:hypothetical protein n=1 Tax=Paenibacillus silvae TaxID=1325358 RepID=UPI003CF08EAA